MTPARTAGSPTRAGTTVPASSGFRFGAREPRPVRAGIPALCGAILPILVFLTPLALAQDLEVLPVHGNVYMFASPLGNVTVQIGKDPGHDGVLLVDSGPSILTPRIQSEIRKLTTQPVRYIINTSSDPDHIGGNLTIAKPDSRPYYIAPEVSVFAHDTVFARMQTLPSGSWPTLTFTDGKMIEFNGEPVQMFGHPGAHTDGDSIALFRGSNVLSAGDIFLTTGYPVIDTKRGGTINGEIKALNHIIQLTIPHAMQEGGTMVIPGHGRLCDQHDVVEYRDMLTIIRDRVADQIKKGKTLAEAKASRPSFDYDPRYSTPTYTGDMLIEAIYQTLKSPGAGK